MSRGSLDDSDWEKVISKTPDLDKLRSISDIFIPDSLSHAFSYQSYIPIASVCLRDSLEVLVDARYALIEAFAQQLWYLEKERPKNEVLSTLFSCFYLDDAVLRLYSAGEHLASGITMMLEISK